MSLGFLNLSTGMFEYDLITQVLKRDCYMVWLYGRSWRGRMNYYELMLSRTWMYFQTRSNDLKEMSKDPARIEGAMMGKIVKFLTDRNVDLPTSESFRKVVATQIAKEVKARLSGRHTRAQTFVFDGASDQEIFEGYAMEGAQMTLLDPVLKSIMHMLVEPRDHPSGSGRSFQPWRQPDELFQFKGRSKPQKGGGGGGGGAP